MPTQDPRFIPDEQPDPRFIPDTPEQESSFWDSPFWKDLTQPPEFISEGARYLADQFSTPRLHEIPTGEPGIWNAYKDLANRMNVGMRGFMGGALEGATTFLNPVDVVGMATGVGEFNAARRGYQGLSKALKAGEIISSIPVAIHGGERLTDPTSTLGEKAAGVAELAGGAAGIFSPRTPVRGVDTGPRIPPVGPEMPPREPLQGELPFAPPQIRTRPAATEGQQILPLDYDNAAPPIRPPVNPAVADAITKPPATAAAAETFEDILGPGAFNAKLTTVDGIHAAFNAGQINQETALRLLSKVIKDEIAAKAAQAAVPEAGIAEAAAPESTVAPEMTSTTVIKQGVEEPENIVFDPESGEVLAPTPSPFAEGIEDIAKWQEDGTVKNVKELQKKTGLSFEETRNLWYQAKEYRANKPKPPAPVEEAPPPKESTVIVSPTEKDFITQLRQDGYKLIDMNKDGELVFGRMEPSDKSAPGFTSKYEGAAERELLQGPGVERSEVTGKAAMPSTVGFLYRQRRSGVPEFDDAVERAAVFHSKTGLSDEEFDNFMDASYVLENHPASTPEFRAEYRRMISEDIEALRSRIKYTEEPGVAPEFARAKGGKVTIGADVKSLGKVLGSSLYSGDIGHIATKELLQNSLDAVGTAGSNLGKAGKIDVTLDRTNKTVTVADNGIGLTRDEVETIFTDLGSSGKRDIESAIGGFGLAKAAPLLGGDHVKVITIAKDKRTGQIHMTMFEGTPDELLDGVPLKTQLMQPGTPTGTTVTVKIGAKGDLYNASNFVKKVGEHSNFQGTLTLDSGWGRHTIAKSNIPDKFVTTINTPSANVNLYIPGSAVIGETNNIELIFKNKGMYQSSESMWLGKNLSDIPNEVVVDIDALVPEGNADYPFTANRETLRGTTGDQVKKYVRENIIKPAQDRLTQGTQELYDGMKSVTTKRGNTIFFHDTGGKMTPDELAAFASSPVIHRLGDQLHNVLNQALHESGNVAWQGRLRKIGFIFDDKLRGIHIPNPAGGTSAILINPMQLISGRSPDGASAGILHTTLHELAHVEPNDSGHGEQFCIRLGDIYEQYGASRAIYEQKLTREILTGGSGSYTPEIQDLLQLYADSRRRSTVTEDVLTRTGTGARATDRGETSFSPGSKPTGKGTLGNFPIGKVIVIDNKNSSPEALKKLYEEGFRYAGVDGNGRLRFKKEAAPGAGPILESEVAGVRPTNRALRGQLGVIQDAQKSNAIMEAFNFPRGVMASWDFSAPLRQGLPMIHKREFWTALSPMFKSWATEEGFQASQAAIAQRPLFKKRPDPRDPTKSLPSFADDAGLKLTDLLDLSSREEAIMSTWAESGGYVEGKSRGIPGVSEAYAKTFGKVVRKSNRAYTAFLNNLRADVFENLIKDAGIFTGDPKAIERNLPLARAIADFVNTATGRGKLAVDIPKSMQGAFGGKTEISLESSATLLNTALFAPRLIASRVKMLNPATYLMAPPQVRKEYLKSLFALAGFGTTILGLAKMAGADVETDPTNSDFGKGQIGNVRIDPWGGFQQYVVLAARLMSGRVSSSTSEKEYNLYQKKGPYDPTHFDVAARFVRGKTNPVVNFAWAWADAQREMSGQKMNFGTPNPFENSITQRLIPIFVQDVYQLASEDPELLPLAVPAAFGMGIQAYENPTARRMR